MPWYPRAIKRRVAWADARDDSTQATIVVLHVTASNAASQYSYFNTSRKACSHFHVALDGTVEQYINTDHLSAADVEGSNDAISIETAGLGSGAWTGKQLSALAGLLAWIHHEHGIPLVLKSTSRPAERGIGWHRLGISGNFPSLPSLLAGRNQRGYAGESWSSSFGKVCPGDKRILQIPDLVAVARRIVAPPSRDGDRPPLPTSWRRLGTLRIGAEHDGVKLLQKRVHADPDGVFGPQTEEKVKYYQRKYGLVDDGVVGPATWCALLQDDDEYLRPGDENVAVLILQRILVDVSETGLYGPVTESEVRQMQAELGTGVTGVVGPVTRAALYRAWV